jgi:hypothetical protein
VARFIDADALQLEPDPWGGMNGVLFLGRNGGKTMAMVQSALKRMIDDAPTIDAVPVVRCKDCKHSVWDEENEMWKCVESADYDEDSGEWFGFCEYHNGDFFCADGERKVNGSWFGNKGKF